MQIETAKLRELIVKTLDYIADDLGVAVISIDDSNNFYWNIPGEQLSVMRDAPKPDVGSLSDDCDFIRLAHASLEKGEAPAPYILIHAAPLLRYVAELQDRRG
jgi:hypothetical protein